MNTSSSFNTFTSLPSIYTSKPTRTVFHNPRSSYSRFSPKTIRCIRNSLNLGSSPSLVSFATVSFEPTKTSDKLRVLVSEFRSLTEPIDRVKRLLNYAATLPPLDDSARISANRVTGCAAQVWLEIKIDEFGRMRFKADSDSEISKGFCSCLIWILDGAKPEEVMSVRSEDLSDMNVGVYGKEQSRVNTWHNVLMSMQKRTMTLVAADVAQRGGDRGPHQFNNNHLFKYDNGSYMESSSKLPLYYDFTI